MKLYLEPGKYVVAVSGGVDSVVLLHLLAQKRGREMFVVAHFDHGIRPDSVLDRKFSQKLAAKYDLPFVYEEGKLGPNTSEAKAREARYKFLNKVLSDNDATAIITAHHQDDLLETAVLNILRGTNRQGITSLKSRLGMVRPLLNFTKNQIRNYAKKHGLKWREDLSNSDTKYLRNYIRQNITPKISKQNREVLHSYIASLNKLNPEIDQLLADLIIKNSKHSLDRDQFIALPYQIALEVMAKFLKQNQLEVNTKTLNRLTIASKTYKTGSKADISKQVSLKIKAHTIEV